MSSIVTKIASKFPWFDVVDAPKVETEKKIIGYTPAKGHTWNPLRSFPPNAKCFCASGTKAKKCCLYKLSKTMEIKDAVIVHKNWEKIVSGEIRISEQ